MSIVNRRLWQQSDFKALLWDWDVITAASDDECCFSLTEKEQQILLVAVEYVGWITRWVSPTEDEIEQETVTEWSANLARKLMSGCCPDDVVLHRVGADGSLEISTDGGATWIPDPADPRLTGTNTADTIPGVGTGKRCNAATNCIGNFKDAQAAFATSLSTATTIIGLALELAGEVILLLLSAGTAAEVLVPLMISAATALFGILETDYNAEFTSEVWDTLLCDIFCAMKSDGSFDTSAYNDLLSRVDTDFTGNVALTFTTIIRGWGVLGLNNAARIGVSATADCTDCLSCLDPCDHPEDYFLYGHVDSVIDNGDGTRDIIITATEGGDTTLTVNWQGQSIGSTCCHITQFEILDNAHAPTITSQICGGSVIVGSGFTDGCYANIGVFLSDFTGAFRVHMTFSNECT